MSKVTVREAAILVGKSRDTINEACRDGTLTSALNERGVRVIDVSELGRVYTLVKTMDDIGKVSQRKSAARSVEPTELLQKVALLELQLQNAERERDLVKTERERERGLLETQIQALTKALEQGGQAMKLLADQSAQKAADEQELKVLKKAVRRVIQDNKILREEKARKEGRFFSWLRSGQPDEPRSSGVVRPGT